MSDRRVLKWGGLVAILLMAAFFRLYRLRTMPWGLSQDEVGNASISLGLLGGEHAPFLSGGFGHEPLFHFLQAFTITLFGDNVVGIRVPAVTAGMLLVAVSYALMHRWFGSVSALATAAALAISWWPTIFSRIGIRAITLPLTLTLAAYFFSRATKPPAPPRPLNSDPPSQSWTRFTAHGSSHGSSFIHHWPFALSGFFLGLSVYTYTAARTLPLLVLVLLGHSLLFQRPQLRHHWRGVVLTLCLAAVIAAPLYAYLQAHPELEERVRQLSGPLDALRRGDPAPLWQGIRATLGMFSFDGDARWTYGIPSRPIFEPLGGALFYLGLILSLARASRFASGASLIWLLISLTTGVLAPDAPSTIRTVGALPVAYGMIGVSVAWLWRWVARRGRLSRVSLAMGLGLLALGNVAWTYRDGFVTWAEHPETYWLYKAHFADIAEFLDEESGAQPSVVVEAWVDPADVNGLRRDLRDDERQPRWAQAGRSLIWPTGADRFTLAVPIYSVVDPDVWHFFADVPPVTAVSPYRMPDGRPGVTFYAVETEPHLSSFLAQASTSPVMIPQSSAPVTLPVDFGGQFAFLGYQVLNAAEPGGEFRLGTVWRIEQTAQEPVNVFVHLLDADGHLVAQNDAFDAWLASLAKGDVVAQLHALPMDGGLPPGLYRLQLGIYKRADLQRLPVLVDGAEVTDRLWLDLVEVRS